MIDLGKINQAVASDLEARYPGEVIWVNTPFGKLPTLKPGPAIDPESLVSGTIHASRLAV